MTLDRAAGSSSMRRRRARWRRWHASTGRRRRP